MKKPARSAVAFYAAMFRDYCETKNEARCVFVGAAESIAKESKTPAADLRALVEAWRGFASELDAEDVASALAGTKGEKKNGGAS